MRGFTLVELLLVVSIISLLAVVSLGYIGGQLARGRDARRRAELEQIRSALEMYRADNIATGYPGNVSGFTVPDILVTNGYLRELFRDPLSSSYFYKYFKSTFSTYTLGAYLEGGNTDSRTRCPLSFGPCGNSRCNYCVFDP